jgi:hypothetical protein
MTLRPPSGFVPPTSPGLHADTRRRVLAQEQRPAASPGPDRFCLTAVSAGPISAPVVAGPWRPWIGSVELERVTVDLRPSEVVGAAGVLAIERDGVTVVEITDLAAGVVQEHPTAAWAPNQPLTLSFDGGAGGVVVQMWFRGIGGGGLVFYVPDEEAPEG